MTDTNPIVDKSGRIVVPCACGKTLKVPKFRQGANISCPSCHQVLSVPELPPDTSPAPVVEAIADPLVNQVQSELAAMAQTNKKGGWKNLVILLISLSFFVSLGLIESSISGILVIIAVLLIHEAGHFIGMKLLRYTDVKMFFIPMLGAAVSGRETNPTVWRKAVVSLLGPVPGIGLGIATGVAYVITRHPLLLDVTRVLLLLNAFNLLPFHPLDGGRFVDAVLFSRSPRAELAFKIVTSLILALLAILAKDVILGMFAFFILMSLRGTYITATIAHRIRKAMGGSYHDLPEVAPEAEIGVMLGPLKEKIPTQHHKPKLFASYISIIWQRLRNKPCSGWITMTLMISYVFCVLLGIASVFAFETAVFIIEGKHLQPPAAPLTESYTTPTNQFYRVTTPSEGADKLSEAGIRRGIH